MRRLTINEDAMQRVIKWGLLPSRERRNYIEESFKINVWDYEDYNDRLELAKYIQSESSIILINPDSNSTVELENTYKEFEALDPKYKTLSNYYSYKIWGNDVRSMYFNVLGELASQVNSSIIVGESSVSKLKMFYNVVSSSGDDLLMEKCKVFKEIDNMDSNSLREVNNSISELTDLDISTGSLCPWFTVTEMDFMNTRLNPSILSSDTDYYSDIMKAKVSEDSRNEILRAGWNPSLNFTADISEQASKRQIEWFRTHGPSIYNIDEDIYAQNLTKAPAMDHSHNCVPVYLITQEQLPTDLNDLFTFFGISLQPTLDEVYMATVKENCILTEFDKVTREDFDPDFNIAVYCVFIDQSLYENLQYQLANMTDQIYFGNVMMKMLHSSNMFDPTTDRITLFIYCYLIHKISSGAMIGQNPTCYRMYHGKMKDYNSDRVDQMTNIFFDNGLAEQYILQCVGRFSNTAGMENIIAQRISDFKNEICIPRGISISRETALELKRIADEKEEERALKLEEQRAASRNKDN